MRRRQRLGSGQHYDKVAADELIEQIRKKRMASGLKIHGLVCAKCARDFSDRNRHLLTVHHKDGNHENNPPDGSNWENLCVYCHDDEHSRSLLGGYDTGKE